MQNLFISLFFFVLKGFMLTHSIFLEKTFFFEITNYPYTKCSKFPFIVSTDFSRYINIRLWLLRKLFNSSSTLKGYLNNKFKTYLLKIVQQILPIGELSNKYHHHH